MASTVDIIVALTVVAVAAYFLRNMFGTSDNPDKFASQFSGLAAASSGGDGDDNILSKMKKNKKTVVVFYGSQTGTAEDLASKLAKEFSSRFGLAALTADLEDYEYDCLSNFPEDHYAVFMMASYGEGEPTDNAQNFWTFLFESPEFADPETPRDDFEESPLANLHFAVFGLGNSTYELYNQVGRDLDKKLAALGGNRFAEYGEGDDGAGTMEEDYLAWKEELMTNLKNKGYEERDYVYEPSFKVEEQIDLSADSEEVYLGEPNEKHLKAAGGDVAAPFSNNNPALITVKSAHELFKETSGRHCVHMEFDLSGTGLKYTTGDHLAFWAQNSNKEVERFLDVFDLARHAHDVIDVKKLDSTATIRFPRPTTYDTVVRYFLEINGPVSRQLLTTLVGFAPSKAAEDELRALSDDKKRFHDEIAAKGFNLARLLSKLSHGAPWSKVPFTFLIESVPHLQPRYYSISSSSVEDKNIISITAVVEREKHGDFELRGVATNYIYDIKEVIDGKLSVDNADFQLAGPRGHYAVSSTHLKVPVHVRHSSFKLPSKASTPIIMVGPGTGVAPFRGFIRERAAVAEQGKDVGKALLFFGCRSKDADFLYGEHWHHHSSADTVGKSEGPFNAKNFLEVQTAFSRDGPNKVYVQHRMKEQGKLINELLEAGAYFYICGDASRMARDVHSTLLQIISEHRGVSAEQAATIVKKMKSRNLYQEDVW